MSTTQEVSFQLIELDPGSGIQSVPSEVFSSEEEAEDVAKTWMNGRCPWIQILRFDGGCCSCLVEEFNAPT